MRDPVEIVRKIDSIKGMVIGTGLDGMSAQFPYRKAMADNPSILRIIAGWGGGWDHVSVSLHARTPTWAEMCYVKEMFFEDEECCYQLHPPRSKYINTHKNCLHIWRPQDKEIELPPLAMV